MSWGTTSAQWRAWIDDDEQTQHPVWVSCDAFDEDLRNLLDGIPFLGQSEATSPPPPATDITLVPTGDPDPFDSAPTQVRPIPTGADVPSPLPDEEAATTLVSGEIIDDHSPSSSAGSLEVSVVSAGANGLEVGLEPNEPPRPPSKTVVVPPGASVVAADGSRRVSVGTGAEVVPAGGQVPASNVAAAATMAQPAREERPVTAGSAVVPPATPQERPFEESPPPPVANDAVEGLFIPNLTRPTPAVPVSVPRIETSPSQSGPQEPELPPAFAEAKKAEPVRPPEPPRAPSEPPRAPSEPPRASSEPPRVPEPSPDSVPPTPPESPVTPAQPRAAASSPPPAAAGEIVSRDVAELGDEARSEAPPAPPKQKIVVAAPQPPGSGDLEDFEDTDELDASDIFVDDDDPPTPPQAPATAPPNSAPPPIAAAATPPTAPSDAKQPPPVTERSPTSPKTSDKTPPVPPPAAPGAGAPHRWVEAVFSEHYSALERPHKAKVADADVDFFIESTGLVPGAAVLDLGCGNGQHCLALARRGFAVTGIDNSPAQIRRAKDVVQQANVTLITADMRSAVSGKFDAVLCVGGTFGYFGQRENQQVLANIARVLKPGGAVMLQTFNRDYVLSRLPARSWWQGDGCLVLDEAQLDYMENRLTVNRTVVFEDGQNFAHNISISAYSAHEISRMCEREKLSVKELSGSRVTRGRLYGAMSPQLWVLARLDSK